MIDRRPWLDVLSHAVMIIGVAIVAFPIYLALIASTHTAQEIVQAPMVNTINPMAKNSMRPAKRRWRCHDSGGNAAPSGHQGGRCRG